MPTHYIYLFIAVMAEMVATSCLKLSDGFTKPIPTIFTLAGFAVALFMLSLTLRYMPIGIVYAVWSGLGIVLITLIGLIFFKQSLDLAAYMGMALIIAGVLVLHLFSKSSI